MNVKLQMVGLIKKNMVLQMVGLRDEIRWPDGERLRGFCVIIPRM